MSKTKKEHAQMVYPTTYGDVTFSYPVRATFEDLDDVLQVLGILQRQLESQRARITKQKGSATQSS